MPWDSHHATEEEAPFPATEVPLLSSAGASNGSHSSSVTSPLYRRHTAIEAPGEHGHLHDPLSNTDDAAVGGMMTPCQSPGAPRTTARDVPEAFRYVEFSQTAGPEATPPAAASVVIGTGETTNNSVALTANVAAKTSTSGRVAGLGRQHQQQQQLAPKSLTRPRPSFDAFTAGPRDSFDGLNLDMFSPFHAPLRPSLGGAPTSLDNSLRSPLSVTPGGGTGAVVNEASFLSGTVRTLHAPSATAAMTAMSTRQAPQPGAVAPPAAPRRGSTGTLAPPPAPAPASAPASTRPRRLTRTENGPLAPHRLLGEATLSAVCSFLEYAGREMEDVALQQAIAKGESCLFTGTEELGTVSPRSRRSAERGLSAPASAASVSEGTAAKQPPLVSVVVPSSITDGVSYRDGPLAPSASAASDSVRVAQEQQEEDVLRLVKATHFPFKKTYNDYQFTEAWFADGGPVCDTTGDTPQSDAPVSGAVQPLVALTEDPLFFVDGMLFDAQSNRFLFNGLAFREEARVFAVLMYPESSPFPTPPPSASSSSSHPPCTTHDDGVIGRRSPLPPSSAFASQEGRPVKVLQRDFLSLYRPDGAGVIVQSFSLLPANAPVEANKQQVVPAEVVRRLVPSLGTGTLTRAFPLSHVAREALRWRQDTSDAAGNSVGREGAGPPGGAPTLPHSHRGSPPQQPVPPGVSGVLASSRSLLRHAGSGGGGGGLQDSVLLTSMQHTGGSAGSGGSATLELMGSVDAIKQYLRHYRIGRFRAHVGLYEQAVRRVQRFLRACLAKKQRALQRMLRLWRRLEVESRLKLTHYKAPPSSVERVDMVANTILQQHMLTTRDSKVKLIADLWQQRRLAYLQWVRRGHIGGSASAANDKAPKAMGHAAAEADESTGGRSDGRPSSSRPRRAQRLSRTAVLPAVESTLDVTDGQRRTRADREHDLRHARFGWYLPPESLLLESHKRLLEGLKRSVLSMEQVRYEVERAVVTGKAAQT